MTDETGAVHRGLFRYRQTEKAHCSQLTDKRFREYQSAIELRRDWVEKLVSERARALPQDFLGFCQIICHFAPTFIAGATAFAGARTDRAITSRWI